MIVCVFLYSNLWNDKFNALLLHESNAGPVFGFPVSRHQEHIQGNDNNARFLARELPCPRPFHCTSFATYDFLTCSSVYFSLLFSSLGLSLYPNVLVKLAFSELQHNSELKLETLLYTKMLVLIITFSGSNSGLWFQFLWECLQQSS